MHLDEISCNEFFDAMDSLLYFTNKRFDVVKDYRFEITTQLDEAKAGLVSRTLWENSAIVEDYCRANPDHLPAHLIDEVRRWEYALSDTFSLVRYQDGHALLMNDAGVFAVAGLTVDLDDVMGPAPAFVRTTLLAFRGVVICDGFLQAFDANESEISAMQDKFEAMVSNGGIVFDASDFVSAVREYQRGKLDDDMDALLEEISREAFASAEGSEGEAGERLPEGFHRGLLADPQVRDAYERSRGLGKPLPIEFALDLTTLGLAGRFKFNLHDELAIRVASCAVLLYGLAPLLLVYDQYRAVDSKPVPFERFSEILVSFSQIAESTFTLWHKEGAVYLVHYTLTESFVSQQVVNAHYQSAPNGEGREDDAAFGEQKPTVSEMQSVVDRQIDDLAKLRETMIMQHRDFEPKPITEQMLAVGGPLGALWHHPCVRDLESFVDAHVPDTQDDYSFGEYVTEDVVRAAIEIGDMSAIDRYIEDIGMKGCSFDEGVLSRLISNVFKVVPSWENNGWSTNELMEKLTGRRIFYGVDGRELRIGPNDPCPCGSGKTYKDCCGR